MTFTPTTILRLVVLFFFLSSAGALTCVLQALTYLLIRPFSLHLSRRIILYLSQTFLLCPSLLLEHYSSVRIITHGTKPNPNHTTLCLMQHACDTDSLLGLAWLSRLNYPYPGNAKCIVKRSLGDVPVFGWILRFAEYIFISRNWQKDHNTFIEALKSLKSYPNPWWIVLYPEGSRFTKEKLKFSQEFARSKGYPLVHHVLFPRLKGFGVIVDTIRDEIDSVVDATVVFEGEPPSVSAMLAGTADCTMHAYIRTYPVKDIPKEDEQVQKWLINRWVEKDEIIAKFKRDISSLGPSIDSMERKPSYVKLYVLFILACLVDLIIIGIGISSYTAFKILITVSSVSVAVIAVFTAIVLKPSSKGSPKGHANRTITNRTTGNRTNEHVKSN